MFRALALSPLLVVLAVAGAGAEPERPAAAAPPPGMVFIPGGQFTMGRDVEGKPTNDTPAHPVTLKAFFIDRYEATNARFVKFIDAKGYEKPEFWSEDGKKWIAAATRKVPERWDEIRKTLGDAFANHPVVGISWFEAEAFAAFEGFRLPTEEEWERAARGTDGRVYPWGNDFAAGFSEKADPAARTRAVGGNAADVSPEGLFDMGGNVSEWTASFYEGYPGTKFVGRYWGPEAERRFKVARGGSWRDLARGQRAGEHLFKTTRRLWEYGHENGQSFIGVRFAKSAE